MSFGKKARIAVAEDPAKKDGRKMETAKFPWAASGRTIANGAQYALTKLRF